MTNRSLVMVGGRGYAGGELLCLLARHPGIELKAAVSSSQAGGAFATFHASMAGSRYLLCCHATV